MAIEVVTVAYRTRKLQKLTDANGLSRVEPKCWVGCARKTGRPMRFFGRYMIVEPMLPHLSPALHPQFSASVLV